MSDLLRKLFYIFIVTFAVCAVANAVIFWHIGFNPLALDVLQIRDLLLANDLFAFTALFGGFTILSGAYLLTYLWINALTQSIGTDKEEKQ